LLIPEHNTAQCRRKTHKHEALQSTAVCCYISYISEGLY